MSRTTARRGPGRPSDGEDRRGAILAAARAEFAEKGYVGTSVRGIARAADVDAALVHHYFGTKERVFVAAMELPFDPADRLPLVLAGDPAGTGERMVRMFLGMWSDPQFRAPMLGLVRSAFTSEQGATMLREFVGTALLGRVAAGLGLTDPLRIEAAAAQLIGLVVLRYVVQLEPIASASEDELVRLVAPTVQGYLVG
ncbi:MAG: TetR/AcrR family transcriptional regulator [Sporichthyaceae bacterium]|nr:TetR/AcrR family transcriptional regulator [Sporichthyaceae bacterium]